MKVPLLMASLALIALSLAGCSGGGGGAITPTQDDDGRYVIKMSASGGNIFLPKAAKVPAGATVVWVNEGATPHNVIADDGSFNSDSETGDFLVKGDEFEHSFPAAGTVRYQCHLHPGMVGTVTVEA